MSIEIEDLELKVESDAGSADEALQKLSETLGRIRSITKGGLGLSSVVKNLNSLGIAAMGFNSGDASGLSSVAKAISSLRGVKISSTIATQLAAVGTAARGLNGVDFSPIASLSTAISPLSEIGRVNLNSAINQLVRVPEAANAVGAVDMSGMAQKVRDLMEAIRPLTEFPKQTISSSLKQLKALPDVFTTLNRLDIRTFSEKIREVADAIRPLADEMNKVAAGFSSFPAKLQRLVASTNTAAITNKRASKSYVDLYAKLKLLSGAARRVSGIISDWVTESTSYIENINLFTVSMGTFASQAKAYAEQVGEVMGIDPGEWMRNQGVFMTLATGFGVAGDRAYVMSQQLTQLGYDLSSFFNIDFADSMQKIQSGLSGELEPLRRLGYDLSNAKLQATALSLGIDKAVSSMTQAEKAELRYYAIMTQATTSHGDMARTLAAPANQLRIFKSQLTQAARAVGNIFIPALNSILPYGIAAMKVLRSLADVVARLFRFELPDVDYSGVTSGAGNISDAYDKVTESAKEAEKTLLGMDEINRLNGGDTSSGIEDILGSGFDFQLPEYDFLNGAIDNRVNDIVDSMKEWLGITDDIDSWGELFDTRLGKILKAAGAIGVALSVWKLGRGIVSGLKDVLGTLVKIKKLAKSSAFTVTAGIVLTVTGFALEFSGIKDSISKGLGGVNFGEIVGGALLGTSGSAILGAKIAEWIAGAFADSAVAGSITASAGAAVGAGAAGIIAGLPMAFTGIYDACVHGINWLNGALIPIGTTAAGAGIGTIIGTVAGTAIAPGVGTLIGLAVGLLTDGIILLVQNWDDVVAWYKDSFVKQAAFFRQVWDDAVEFMKGIPGRIRESFVNFEEWLASLPETVRSKLLNIGAYLDSLPRKLQEWFFGLAEDIRGWFADLWRPVQEFDWSNLGYNIGQWFGNAFRNAAAFVTKTVPEWFSSIWESVTAAFSTFFTQTLPQFFTETVPNVVQSVADFFKSLPERLKKIFVSMKSGIVDIGKSIWDGISEGLSSGWTAIKDFASGLVDGFKDALGIHSPSKVFFQLAEYTVDGFNNGIYQAGRSTFGIVNRWVDSISSVQPELRVRADSSAFEQTYDAAARYAAARAADVGRDYTYIDDSHVAETVSVGVSSANAEQNALLREEISILRALLERDTTVRAVVTTSDIVSGLERKNRRDGRTVVPVG